jgi:hypothetical protein
MGEIYQYAACTLVSLMNHFRDMFLETERQDISIPYRTSVRLRPLSGKYNLVFDGVENTRCGAWA